MPALQLPEYGKHIVLLGSTGSGKSELAKVMLSYYKTYMVLDTQDSLDDVEGIKVSDPRHVAFWLKMSRRIRYVPKDEWKSKESYDYVFYRFLNSSSKKRPKERVLYVDEIFHIGYGMSFPTWLPRGLTTARQKKLSFWIATQRPRMIPAPVMSEAAKIYVFYLSKWEDIKFVSGFSRADPKKLMAALQSQQDDYSFIAIDNRKGTWQKFPKIYLGE